MSEDNRSRSRSRVPLVDTKRRSRSCDNLDWSSESQSDDEPIKARYSVPVSDAKKSSYRTSAVYDLDDDMHPAVRTKPKLVRVKSRKSHFGVSYSRSLDSLNLLSPDAEWTMKQADSQRSLHSFASNEELEKERSDPLDQEDPSQGENDEPQSPIPAEASTVAAGHLGSTVIATPGQVAGPIEVAGLDCQTIVSAVEATPEQAPIPIEVVASEMVLTCKCQSKEACTHTIVWKGVLSEDGTIEFSVQSKDGSVRIVRFPRENSVVMRDTDVEKVCKMIVQTVLTNP